MPVSVPVFVDGTGRRRRASRWVGRLIPTGVVAYLALLGAGFSGNPQLSEPGLPALVVAPPMTGGVGTPPDSGPPIPESFAAPTPPSTTSTTSRPHTSG